MDWRSLLNSSPADSRILYDVGNEYGLLGDGRVLLTLTRAGRFSLEQSSSGMQQGWDGDLSGSVFSALMTLLAEAGFPAAPALGDLPPDEDLRQLRVEARGQTASATFTWHDVDKGWKRVFGILDAIVSQAAQGELTTFQSKVPNLVSRTARRAD